MIVFRTFLVVLMVALSVSASHEDELLDAPVNDTRNDTLDHGIDYSTPLLLSRTDASDDVMVAEETRYRRPIPIRAQTYYRPAALPVNKYRPTARPQAFLNRPIASGNFNRPSPGNYYTNNAPSSTSAAIPPNIQVILTSIDNKYFPLDILFPTPEIKQYWPLIKDKLDAWPTIDCQKYPQECNSDY